MVTAPPPTGHGQFDGRPADIEATPLVVASASYRSKTLVEGAPDLLLIKPSLGDRVFSSAFLLAGLGAVLVGVLAFAGFIQNVRGASPTRVGWFALGLGLLFTLVGAGLLRLSKSFAFDRRRGIVESGKSTWRFADIAAIQLLCCQKHSMSNQLSHDTFQLNLVVKDPAMTRMNLSNHTDRDWTCTTAARLAEFLKVPLLDQIEPK